MRCGVTQSVSRVQAKGSGAQSRRRGRGYVNYRVCSDVVYENTLQNTRNYNKPGIHVFFFTSRLLVAESGNPLFVHRGATRGGIWGFFFYACWMCHLIATGIHVTRCRRGWRHRPPSTSSSYSLVLFIFLVLFESTVRSA
jgi:hypothetical protein